MHSVEFDEAIRSASTSAIKRIRVVIEAAVCLFRPLVSRNCRNTARIDASERSTPYATIGLWRIRKLWGEVDGPEGRNSDLAGIGRGSGLRDEAAQLMSQAIRLNRHGLGQLSSNLFQQAEQTHKNPREKHKARLHRPECW